MNVEEIRNYALKKNDVTESFPFGEDTLVFKTNGKIFLLLALNEQPVRFNVKADPGKAIEWREFYPESVLPGYHMNKKHWNTVIIKGLKNNLLAEMIDHSYSLVNKKVRNNEK